MQELTGFRCCQPKPEPQLTGAFPGLPARTLENAKALQVLPCFHQHSFLTCHPVHPWNIGELLVSSSSLSAMAFAWFGTLGAFLPFGSGSARSRILQSVICRACVGLKGSLTLQPVSSPSPIRTHGGYFSRLLPAQSPAQAAATATVASGRLHPRDFHPLECLASIAAFQTHKWVLQVVCQFRSADVQ